MDEYEEIKKVFELLDIEEDQYPEYTDPESFAADFKKCSILKSHDIIESVSTAKSVTDFTPLAFSSTSNR